MRQFAFPLVRLERRFDAFPWYGFVVSESEHLIVLHFVSERYDLDGYRCIRRADVTLLEEDFPRSDLIHRAVRLKNLQAQAPAVEATAQMREMMQAVQRKHGLLTIHREAVHEGECEIGEIRISAEATYVLRWLDANACWDPDDRPFRYADVTRLDFGGEYERTLLMVADDRARGA